MDKQALRERVWDDLEERGVARFPFPPHDRISNFVGADEAAERLAAEPEFADADVLKANPDAPQLPVRRRALAAGKTVYVARPRLREADCFLELDPDRIEDTDDAATVSSMDEYGEPVGPAEVAPVDLVVSGSVAVTADGVRVGKGEGYSDLEYAVLSAFDRVDADTPVATTVHERQVVEAAPAPEPHDVPMDLVVTSGRAVRTETPHDRPAGVDWSLLDEEDVAAMPVLARLRD